MTYEQIDRLLNAGFTPEQIMQLASAPADSAVPPPAGSAGGVPPKTEPTENSGKAPEPEPVPTENSQQAPEPEPAQAENSGHAAPEPGILQEIKTGFEDLKKTIQANNIKTLAVDTLPGAVDSAEKILAGIIRPPFDDKNNIGGNTK